MDAVLTSASEMTYIVSGGALNSTHSLTQFLRKRQRYAGNQVSNAYANIGKRVIYANRVVA